MKASEVVTRLRAMGDPARAQVSRWFFKTGPGEYGEGDRFVGIRVPELRRLAATLDALPLAEVVRLLASPLHEARLLALLLLVRAYAHGDEARRERIYALYLAQTRRINNWDLVDVSSEHIVGRHLAARDRSVLDRLAESPLLWERRIAVLATFHFVRRGEFGDTLRLAARLLDDREDLMHKAVGWLLREVGKRDLAAEENFLKEHAGAMPRTMLRYAIERFPEPLRQRYLRAGRGRTAIVSQAKGVA